jgi:predicted ATPase
MSGSAKAIFLSYASQDADAAERICLALRAAGVEVWFDRSELRGGDAWDAAIRRQVKECALFVPLISANTQSRSEGYFRREWNLAVNRMLDMAEDQPYLLPVAIDDTAEPTARVPDRFRERQWTRIAQGVDCAPFVERVVRLLAAEHGAAEAHRAGTAASGVAPRPGVSPPSGGAPAPVLLGREAELQELQAAVEAHALVTLIGPGGIGKTTLAGALAQRLSDAYADGVRIVELAALVDSSLVVATVAGALAVPGNIGSQLERLVAYMAAKRLLIVLDNCEQVIDGVAALAEAIHGGAPGVRLLATSQIPVKLTHECLVRLGNLALPATDELPVARRAGAVALFAARAAAADARFALDERNIGAVADICRRLDGIPLAIELAAARVALLGVQGVRTRLDERFRLLTKGARLAPPRQQTLRAALDWSHGLLSADERAVFRRLAIFRGSFGLSAVQHLAADAAIDEWAVLDLLGNLIDRSLVVAVGDAAADEPRYALLETMAEYARAQLDASSERVALARRHADFFHALAEAQWQVMRTAVSGAARTVLTLNHDNMRAALDWAAAHDIALGVRLGGALIRFWRENGHHAEAMRRCEALLERAGTQGLPGTSRVLGGLCALPYELGDIPRVRAFAERGLAASRIEGDRLQETQALDWLGIADYVSGNPDSALERWKLSLRISRETGELREAGIALCNIGTIHNDRGDRERALALFNEAMEAFRQTGFRWGLGMATESLGEVTYASGDFEAARSYWLQSLAEHRALPHQFRIVTSLQRLGLAELRLGRLEAARACLAECLALCVTHGFEGYRASSLAVMARVVAAHGDLARAARVFGAAQKMLDELGMVMEGPAGTDHADALAAARGGLDACVWQCAWNEGLTLEPAAAVALALESERAAPGVPAAKVG